ncbi:MAG: hypothetical protein K5989_05000 [Lachnospiraceae bacterium]|nr:hypothetical protein [Lachnospiraceae bacterium]
MKIDNRTVEDIENRIEELARNYTPEWHFDRENRDIGSALAKIFSIEMKENIDLVNRIPDRYHTALVNMLDLSLKPVKPAGSVVRFELIADTVPGTYIRKGTRLSSDAEDEDGSPVLFETDREIYVTNSRLTDAFMTDREDGTLVPLLGDFPPVRIIEGEEDEEAEPEPEMLSPEAASGIGSAQSDGGQEDGGNQVQDETMASQIELTPPAGEEEAIYYRRQIRPFVLFSEIGNIAKTILILYHEAIFDLTGEPIYIRISGNESLNQRIEAGEFSFQYYTKGGFTTFEKVRLLPDKETFELIKDKENRKVTLGNRKYAIVILVARDILKENEEVSFLGISSSGGDRSADYVNDGSNDMDPEKFAPFTDMLSVYNECYIGQDLYFSKKGARVTVTFHVNYEERGFYLKKEEEEDLRIIKKKPKVVAQDIPADAFADEIELEYFNSIGWKRLVCANPVNSIFANEKAGDVEFSFLCPYDWAESQSGADSGRCIRMRLIRSDNCYLRPGIHHYPVISDLRIRFSYEGRFTPPSKLFLIAGTEKRDITLSLMKGGRFPILYGGHYEEDALYLGFQSRMEAGPVSIYFELEDVVNQNGLKCYFEYSTSRGFRRMKVVDYTGGFTRSGAVMFVPPSDMHTLTLLGKRRFWIRVTRDGVQLEGENAVFLPRIRTIMMNVVNVSNIVTGNEENYYISEISPSQHFPLRTRNIMDAVVWVNEKGYISREEMDILQMERPEDIRIEYDRLGNPSAVYVKWEETDSFYHVTNRRCYIIDRISDELIFSDGIKADIPKVTDDISFKVSVRSSNGLRGNVDAGQINETVGNQLYIENISNPVRAYGGSNVETVRNALRRGANLLYGRKRLVSIDDYIWEILNFSDSIDKAVCIPGETLDGLGRDSDLSFVLLMKDFMDGSFSFHRIADPLKAHLAESSSITVDKSRIHVVEPIFVEVSVSVWADLRDIDESFEIQNQMTEILKDYFNPVSRESNNGWEIGNVPKNTQVLMKLATLKSHAIVKKTVMVARYVDKDGLHETDLSELNVSPFMVLFSGNHRIYFRHI